MAIEKSEAAVKKIATTKTPVVEKKAARKPVKAKPRAVAEKPEKKPKAKVVRDFSMPQAEYQKIAEIKEICLKAGLRVKKSEVLRAGLKALDEMNEAQLKHAIAGMGKTITGHPKKA